MTITGKKIEIISDKNFPPLRFVFYGERSVFTSEGGENKSTYYRSERDRGYEFSGMLWNPGYFRAELFPGRDATLVASTENWYTVLALKPREAIDAEASRRRALLDNTNEHLREGIAGELVLAADQFIITPAGRAEDAVRVSAAGSTLRSIIAGYHWFTDWGRDTMISLEGLTLITGRHHEAHWILKTFAHYVKDGLIPNLFPEGQKQGLYHTADATLWFFHAIDRYIVTTGDKGILKTLLPILIDIMEHHIRGTKFGICVDHEDALLRQGKEGYQLTWMDAKVDDWVVTPRRGKVVEINALWYNALCLMSEWLTAEDDVSGAGRYKELSDKAGQSFNQKFWCEEKKHLYDIVEGEYGNDNACRPNQIFSISLKYPVLDKSKWEQVFQTVKEKLLTPVGLRSLAPDHLDYKSKYFGDLRARDAAYHQGTVWGWLIGPFIDAFVKIYPEDISSAKDYLSGFDHHLNEACIGSVSEIFDAESPYSPRGCIAQAWSVAELLRCYNIITERKVSVDVNEQMPEEKKTSAS
jgi:predicted glycogen debranching enzyme